MFKQPKQTIEPFKLFGQDSEIHSEEESYEIIKKNSYYTYLYAYAHIIFALIFMYGGSQGEDMNLLAEGIVYFILGLFFLLFAYIVKKRLNKIVLVIYAVFPAMTIITSLNEGMFFLLHMFVLMAMYRIWCAIGFINEKIHKEIKVDPLLNN